MKKIITIIIATFNAEQYLMRCLESISQQIKDDIEVIVQDGGSTDNTISILKSYSFVNCYSEQDKGIYDAWNKAINKSTGDWLMFLGADDVLLPHAIDVYRNYIIQNITANYDIISSKIDIVNDYGKHQRFVGEKFNHNKYCHRDLEFAHPGLLHNRQIFSRYGGFNTDYKICADCEFFIKNGALFNVGFVDNVSVRVQQGGMSVSHRAIHEAYEIRKKYADIPCLENFIGFVKISIGLTLSRIKTKIFKKNQS